MTTTQTCTDCQEPATNFVEASHFDPDADESGRPIGWSRPVESFLCDDCLEDWTTDSLVGITTVEDA